ncbi:hypothetical protein PMI17_00412 [Pantoea sp. GM01]|nr:DUF1028 domain-containing protein [Pantoea sp. GM01]EJL93143.1 hypothetical protein PMI17_00412 [Pantoea sp. GM01]
MVENRVSKYRQVAVIDAGGILRTPVAAKYSVFGTWGTETTVSKQAKYWRVVINAFNTVFEATPGEITTRLLAALQAGIDSGGEVESEQSEAVKVVNGYALPVVNWRVGWVDLSHGQSLKQLMKAYEPQMNAYDSSAFKPLKSKNNGAHGDE